MGEKVFIADKKTLDDVKTTVDGIKTTVEGTKSLLDKNIPKRYGFKIHISEQDPANRVEYIYDAVGMKPAKMDFEKGKFDYGDMKDLWFVKRNYPVVLNRDGSEAYRLNPNDYSKTIELGTAPVQIQAEQKQRSGVNVGALKNGENAMSAIPLVWVKRWQEDGYQYVSFCETQYDESYKAYAHTNLHGKIMPYAYHAIYEGWMDCVPTTDDSKYIANQAGILTSCAYKNDPSACPNKGGCTAVASVSNKFEDKTCKTYLRSVSGVQPTSYTPASWECAAARRTGPGWDIGYWSLNALIGDLLIFMGKSCNTQAVFGCGHTVRQTTNNSMNNKWLMTTGTMDTKGQFWGSVCPKPSQEQCANDYCDKKRANECPTACPYATETESGDGDGSVEKPAKVQMSGVKVFHIENFWGDRWERQLGMCAQNGNLRIKMTPERAEGVTDKGQTGTGYNLAAEGYPAVLEASLQSNGNGNGYRKETVQTEYGSLPVPPFTGSDATYETDYFWSQTDSAVRVSFFGGSCDAGSSCGARCWSVHAAASDLYWTLGASLSYINPLA